MLPALESSETAKLNGVDAPAAGAAGIVKAEAAAPLKEASVPEKTVVEPEVITRFIFEQRSVALPVAAVGVDCVQVAPGVSVKVLAAAVPVFLMLIGVLTVTPGVMVVLPPNLLMVEQVAAFVETEPPSVLRQVTPAFALCSCMISVPAAAVLLLFVMLAANPDSVPVRESERSTAAKMPARSATGAKRMRFSGEMRSWLDTGYLDDRWVDDWQVHLHDCLMTKIASGSPSCYPAPVPRAGGNGVPLVLSGTLRLGTPTGGALVPDRRDLDIGELMTAFDAVVRANASLMTQLSSRAGVHDTALRALVLVSDTGYSTPTEVAGFLGLTSGAVTNMIDRLTDRGVLERRPNPADRRGSLLALTPAGEDVVADLRERYAVVLRAVDAEHGRDLHPVLNDLATGLLDQAATAASDDADH